MIQFFAFRMYFSKGIAVMPKFAPFKDKDGKLYASREKLYANLNAFLIPKSSPLNASKLVDLNYASLSQSYLISASLQSGNFFLAGNWNISKNGE